MQQQQSQVHLAASESALLAAQAQHAQSKAAYEETVAKVERLKSQFREQIMDESLRQSCRWNDMYYKLVEWKEQHGGDTTVPCDAKASSEEVKKLNRWVINQRTAYKYFMNGDKKHIKDHRIDALNKIGFCWSVQDQQWDNNFEELRRHKADTGTFHVTIKQNRKLATFISRLRTAMSHKEQGLIQAELTDERINKLNSLDFTWHMKRKKRNTPTRDTVKFDVMYEHLVSFKEIYGHTKVNKLEKEWKKGNGVPEKKVFRRLPLFLAFARKEQLLFLEGHPSSLDEDKIQMLTELGVEWKKPASEPRKSTGGEATRKKKKKGEQSELSNPPHPGFNYEDNYDVSADAVAAAAALRHPGLPTLPPMNPPMKHDQEEQREI
ncbi:hypothetical protein ACHAXR_011158 [Thalassiosira sp. AJA248-18]